MLMLHRGDRGRDTAKTLCYARTSTGRWINWFTVSGIEDQKSLPTGHSRRWPLEQIRSTILAYINANSHSHTMKFNGYLADAK